MAGLVLGFLQPRRIEVFAGIMAGMAGSIVNIIAIYLFIAWGIIRALMLLIVKLFSPDFVLQVQLPSITNHIPLVTPAVVIVSILIGTASIGIYTYAAFLPPEKSKALIIALVLLCIFLPPVSVIFGYQLFSFDSFTLSGIVIIGTLFLSPLLAIKDSLRNGIKACALCGDTAQQLGPAIESVYNHVDLPSSHNKYSLRYKYVFTAVVGVMGLLLAYLFAPSLATSKSPGERTLEAMKLIRDGKPKQLEEYICREDVVGTAFFSGYISSSFADGGGVSRFEIKSEKVDGEYAKVVILWHYKKGGSDHQSFPLKREEGKWRIDL